MSTSAQGNLVARNEPESGQSHDRPVRWVGKYRILSELGRGGMSNVYLAVARGPGGVNKLVVLKAVLPELASEPGALAMFLDEARLAAQLNHPNVVQTYEVGTEGDRHVIVMEYLEGETLAHVVRRAEQDKQAMTTAMYLRIIINALEGLHYAHELAAYDGSPLLLVHRDISPQNVFVTYGGQVKVLDFGIAKASSSSTQTATGVVKGKIAYMAPEQMIADNIDRRADVYSVGCLLWAAATGRKLWKDTPDVQIMRRVINGDVPTPQSVNLACDDELNRIVMKAIAGDPAHRYETALALQEDLEHYCDRFSAPVKQKDIGGFVSTLFADARAEVKALIERQVSLAMSDDPVDGSSDVRVLGSAGTWQLSGSGTDSRSIAKLSDGALSGYLSNSDLSAQNQGGRANALGARPRQLGWLIAVGVLLVLLLLVSAKYVLNLAATPPKVTSSGQAAPPPPTSATLQFQAQPAQAQLYLDDQPLPSNPASRQLGIDGRTHRLRAEAPGYTTAASEFSAVHDGTIEIALSALPTPAPTASVKPSVPQASAPKRVRVAMGAASATRPPATPSVGCQQPFFVDADGIKKLRPECR